MEKKWYQKAWLVVLGFLTNLKKITNQVGIRIQPAVDFVEGFLLNAVITIALAAIVSVLIVGLVGIYKMLVETGPSYPMEVHYQQATAIYTPDAEVPSLKEYERSQEEMPEPIPYFEDTRTEEEKIQQQFDQNIHELAGCNPTFAWVIDFEGNLGRLNDSIREGAEFYVDPSDHASFGGDWEQWYQLTRGITIWPANPMDYAGRLDNWGNPFWKTEEIYSLYDLPKNKYVWLFNQNGFLWDGYLGFGEFEPYEELICGEDSLEDLVWSTAEELTPVTEANITYTGGDEAWGFNSYFFTGRQLTIAEIRHLYLMEGTLHWYGQGHIGGGSSSHGNFSFDDKGVLIWNDYDYDGRTFETTNSFVVSDTPFPVDTEIVVVTESFWMKDGLRSLMREESQKFILKDCGDGLCMLEPADSEDLNEDYLDLLPGTIPTASISAQQEAEILQHYKSGTAIGQ